LVPPPPQPEHPQDADPRAHERYHESARAHLSISLRGGHEPARIR
jgi:hypothetical protein